MSRTAKRKIPASPGRAKQRRIENKSPLKDTAVAEVRKKRKPGTVLVMGDGIAGQLGLGTEITEKPRPAELPNLNNIIDVQAGGMHTVCLTSDFKVVTFGCNDEGALGRSTSDEESSSVPGEVELAGTVVQICAGDCHSAALLDTGRLFVWGTFRDSHGAMGLINRRIEKTPVEITLGDMRFKKIASGAHHIALLSTEGHVYTFGCGEQGQLGRLSERIANREARNGIAQLLAPGEIKMKVTFRLKFVDIWTGSYNTFAKDSEGNIHVFGLNNYKQMGVESNLYFHPTSAKCFKGKNWIQISGGEHHSMALDDQGIVYTLGRKEYGRLGLGKNCEDAVVPTKVDIKGKCTEISCGSFASFALTEDGHVYSWGQGSTMLGVGDEDDRFEPTLVKGKQLENKTVTKVSGGGQHAVLLASPST
ncbi:regulator of chromosome condensation-like [Rhodnius prolixus]